ncbi:hypothetical protein SAMN05216369_1298 [Marinobacter antarcticus]|uniref:Uncharacterized protein n=1 Tax=Marinobacter antarcticus TaxID=564117 RepID=A0A1M6R4C6_9GAMM|nr:hypothetical protein [Marinobacter antarcticus]SHK27198.1 hypothetical protein SAMN05216369_1298 [Marinobacter antarcticus]
MSYKAPKLNELNNIDIDYYTKLAAQQRSEHIAHMATSLTAKIKSFFHVKLPKLSISH